MVGSLRLSTLPIRRWPHYLALTVLPSVAAVVGASLYLDSRMYGAATVVPLNFLRFNVLEGKSRIFGEQAWHWNFSQGLPAVLGAALPAALWGFCGPRGGGGGGCGSGDRILGWLAVWFLGEVWREIIKLYMLDKENTRSHMLLLQKQGNVFMMNDVWCAPAQREAESCSG